MVSKENSTIAKNVEAKRRLSSMWRKSRTSRWFRPSTAKGWSTRWPTRSLLLVTLDPNLEMSGNSLKRLQREMMLAGFPFLRRKMNLALSISLALWPPGLSMQESSIVVMSWQQTRTQRRLSDGWRSTRTRRSLNSSNCTVKLFGKRDIQPCSCIQTSKTKTPSTTKCSSRLQTKLRICFL